MAAFKLNVADLVFVLKQIKIAEAHSAGTPLTEIYVDALGNVVPSTTPGATLAIPSPLAPFGLRTVDGSFNNLVEGRETWGASDQPMPRLLPSYYRQETDNESFDANGPAQGGVVNNNNYGNNGSVADSDPRLISNLVSDMSFNNPAAIVAALTFNGVEAIYGAGGALETIQTAFATLRTVLDNPHTGPEADAANAAFDAVLAPFGVEHNGASISIPNVAPDEGLSAPFNAWMTFFGQFFDHGLDLINKGGNGTVYVPLQADDPLMTHGADGIAGTGDELSLPANSHLAFMALTRATPSGDTEVNQTTPFVDQNQTYTSNASHQVFLREYKLVEVEIDGNLVLVPRATGHLLDGSDANETVSSLPTWADVKAQALNLLGIRLTDLDVGNIPVLLVDQYGEFVRGPDRGMPQILAGVTSTGVSIWVETDLANPVNPSAIDLPDGTVLAGGNVIDPGETVSAVRTGHAFLDDIAHSAAPLVQGGNLVPDADSDVGNDIAINPLTGQRLEYDNELLDQHYITGDGRGNENIGLTAVHHIFHGEHNRQVEQQKLTILSTGNLAFINEWLAVDITQQDVDAFAGFAAANLAGANNDLTDVANGLNWDGERLFQAARMATEMQYQHLVFEEFARKIQPNIDVFVFNTNPDINPAIFAEFAHVVYRFGHSMLTDNMPRLDENGEPMAAMNANGDPLTADEFGLVASFLNPVSFDDNGAITDDQGAAAIIRGMTIERGNEIDEFLVDALRNNLLGLPLDLGAINIARGRDTGMPSLNQAREALYAASGSTFLEPYENWIDFAANLKNPVSVVNFMAAYGTHVSITSATTAAEKREAAWLLVMGDGNNADGVTIRGVTYSAADRTAFLTATGAYTDKGGLNEIDLWIGGLAEKKMPFGGFLGSTFNAVFELQLENLQDGDRFYYLTRTQGQNFLVSLEQNSFAKMIMANTDLSQPGADGIRGTSDDIIARHMGVDSFAVYDHVLEVNIDNQADYTVVSAADLAAANAAVASAAAVHSDAAEAAALTNVADALALYVDELAQLDVLQANADGQDANDELLALIAAAGADVLDPGYQATLVAAIAAYQTALADDAAADADLATGLQEVLDALAAFDAAEAADGAEADALAALTAAQNALAALIASGAGQDPTGNNPILEAVGLNKVTRIDPTGQVTSNYIRVQGGEHTAVGGTEFDDTIITDFGDDGIWGDLGNDRIESGAGVDLVNGGAGNDIITDSGDTGDFLKGDEGDDVISGGNGLDIYMGGEGSDVVFMSIDASETFAGQGNDFVMGGADADVIMGNEGDDWIEGGAGFDGIDGDMSELFFDSKIIGHDVLFSGSEEQDFEGESGNDIMVQGESVIRNGGQMGFDFVTYKGNTQSADVDLARPIFTTAVQDILRNRFDQVEAASGWNADDLLVGDDRVYDPNAIAIANVDGAAGTVFFRDDIDQTGIDRIAGLDQIITTAQMTPGRLHTAEFGDLYGAAPEAIFGDGNVLIGGGGDDRLIGKGGDDILDGDRWLNVRIQITHPALTGTGTTSIDTLEHVFTAGGNIPAAWVGKSMSQLMIDRVIEASQMQIVREILNGNQVGDVDTAVYWDTLSSYSFSRAPDGALVIEHTGFGANDLPQALADQGFRPVSDGRDTVRNVELFQFGDGNGGFITRTLASLTPVAATGAAVLQGDLTPIEGQTLTVSTASIADANGIASFAFQWQGSADGVTFTDIVGETAATLDIPDAAGTAFGALQGLFLRSVVSVTDDLGTTQVFTSGSTTTRVGLNLDVSGAAAGVTFLDGPDTDDVLRGSNFNDELRAGSGNDQMFGGGGNDILRGGNGSDFIDGGAGTDTAQYVMSMNNVESLALVAGTSDIVVFNRAAVGIGSGNDILRSIEQLQFGNASFEVVVDGNPGGSLMVGNGLSHAMFGGAGADEIRSAAGNDIVVGGAGNDTVRGGGGDDWIFQVGATDGRDMVFGGDGGTDTYVLSGVDGAETFTIFTRAAWDALPGNLITSLAATTEIVITRNGTNNAAIIAELDGIEEIKINSLLTTQNNGNNNLRPDGGSSDGDTINVVGDFTATDLDYSTIRVTGSNANDTVDISGLQSDHRLVFTAIGGTDTVMGSVRSQDILNGVSNDLRSTGTTFGSQDGLDAMVGGSVMSALIGGSDAGEMARGRTMIDMDVITPLDIVDAGPVMPLYLLNDPAVDLSGGDQRSVITDYPVS